MGGVETDGEKPNFYRRGKVPHPRIRVTIVTWISGAWGRGWGRVRGWVS